MVAAGPSVLRASRRRRARRAVEQVGRITSEAISHGVKSFGPSVIYVPVVIAITNVLSATIAALVDLLVDAAESDDSH